MNDRFGLSVQELSTATQRVLAVADLVARRNVAQTFEVGAVREAFMQLQVPPPKNIPQALADLGRGGFTLSHGKGTWSLTPLGRRRAAELLGSPSDRFIEVSDASPGAEFAHVQQTVIPHWAAPPRWQVGIQRLLRKTSFETNVFCMTRFPSEGELPDPVGTAVETLRQVFSDHGMHLYVASDALLDDDLLTNVGAYMWGCMYGVGIVEDLAGTGINYNAVIELGAMITTGRRCAILKDASVLKLPTDLTGQIYKSVELETPVTVKDAAASWVVDDLGLG